MTPTDSGTPAGPSRWPRALSLPLALIVVAHLWMAWRHDWLVHHARQQPDPSAQRTALIAQCEQLLQGFGAGLRLTGRRCGLHHGD